MALRIGELRERVRIEERSTAQDPATGEQAATWALVAERWAHVEPLDRGREVFASAQRNARAPTLFRLRYLAGVVPRMRVVWRGRQFDVVEVQEMGGGRRELVLIAEELVEVAP